LLLGIEIRELDMVHVLKLSRQQDFMMSCRPLEGQFVWTIWRGLFPNFSEDAMHVKLLNGLKSINATLVKKWPFRD